MAHTRSLEEIKRETEQTRAGLTDTVEQLRTTLTETASDLRERVSPAAIKAEVSNYVRTRGEQLLDDMTAAARKNPVQAVAVGASVAYPLLRVVRAIPVPILMIGAGMFLASSKTGRDATQKASVMAADLSEEAMKRGREFRDQLEETATAAQSYATEKLGSLGETVSSTSDRVTRAAGEAGSTLATAPEQMHATASSVGTTVKDGVAQARQQGGQLADSAARAVKDVAAGAAESAQEAINRAKEAGLQTARVVREKAADLTDRTGKTLFQTIEQNPLLVAGVGLLVGGLIASALPKSEIEDELVGGTSDGLKRRAWAATEQGFDAAEQAAAAAVEQASERAKAEGLDPDGIRSAASDVGDRVRRVAEAAVTTAFEPSQEDHSQSALGDKNHG
jgi:hypothetical protein